MNKTKTQKTKLPTEKVAKKFISEMVDARNKERQDEKRALFDKFEIQTKTTGIILENYCH